jgi:hypothetical protein
LLKLKDCIQEVKLFPEVENCPALLQICCPCSSSLIAVDVISTCINCGECSCLLIYCKLIRFAAAVLAVTVGVPQKHRLPGCSPNAPSLAAGEGITKPSS